MNLLSCTVNTLSVSPELPGLELSIDRVGRTGIKLQFAIKVDRKSVFIGNARPTRKWFILWVPLTSKGKTYFFLSMNY